MRDLHEEARAIDFMVPAGSGRNPKGDAVASFLVRYAARLGVQAIIWRRVEWYTTSGPRWEAYAAADHDDHVHTEVTVEAARRSPAEVRAIVDAVLAEEARRTGGGAMVLGGEGIPGLGWFALAGVFATGMGAWALWRRRARRRLTMASYELGPGDGDGY
ncbi:MAG: hypothetical protein JNK72_24830 [Myxococcales bacterium]|nr:hypothetical protein [Myxococcales bacterium]